MIRIVLSVDDCRPALDYGRLKPFKQRRCTKRPDHLRGNENHDVRWPDAGKGVSERTAKVTAGLANDVEAVNQYAAVM